MMRAPKLEHVGKREMWAFAEYMALILINPHMGSRLLAAGYLMFPVSSSLSRKIQGLAFSLALIWCP
ncbi:Uncharacterized protein HZ326_8870 [Fusarium oxysporum f. sp. albedinis]|nr:Uncharacterized protein HZ326_8870 [Fusarium oxysporum f. sp. albedinis]